MAEAVLVFGADYTILYQNAAALALSHVPTGKGREDVDRAIERRTPDGTLLTIDQGPVMRALRGETVRNEEIHFFSRIDGKTSVVLYSADPIRDEAGRVVRAVVNIRDITEQLRMEQKAAEQQAQLQVVFENMAEPLFIVEAATMRVTANAAFRRLFSISEEELQSIGDYRHRFSVHQLNGDPLSPDMWPLRRALRGETFANVELEIRRDDGQSWIISYTGNPVRDVRGNVTQAVLTCRDVTERKRDELQLLRIRYNLETAQSIANVGSWDHDLVTRELWWSGETRRIFGVPAGAALSGDDFYRFVFPEDLERVRARARELLQGRSDYDIEHRIVRADGQIRYVQQRAKRVVNESGEAVRMIGSIQDVTDQKLAEQQLHTQREQLEATLHAIQDGVAVLDTSGQVVLLNDSLLRLLGSESHYEGRRALESFGTLGEFRTPDGALVPFKQWPAARVLKGESLHDLEFLARRIDTGREWYVSISGAPVFDKSGNQVLAVVVARDISEAKRAAEALAASEKRYRTMVMTCPIGLVIGGVAGANKGTLRLVNDAYLRIVGYSREEFERGELRWDSITPAEWLPADEAGIAEMMEHGSASPYEKEYIRKDGSRVPVLAALALLPGGEEAAAFVLDLTDRLESERALRESEERLRTTVEAANIGTFDYRPQTGEVFWDDRSKRLWSWDDSRPSYAGVLQRIHPEDRERVTESVQTALGPAGDGSFDAEYRILSPDGSVRWIVSRGRVYFDSDSPGRSATRMLGINIDVTERKLGEQRLREMTSRFETLANNISQLAWMADREGSIYWYNQRWYTYTGTTPEQVRGWGWAVVHHPDHLQRVIDRFRHSVQTGEPWEDTFPIRSRFGEYRWFLSRALPIRDETGAIVTWFGTNTDITELRETTAELERISRIVKLAHAAGKSGAWEWNLETGEVTWTEEYYGLLGLELNVKPTMKRFFSLVHPEDRERVMENVRQSIRQCAHEFRTEFRTLHSGVVRWIERRGQVICNESGNPVRMVGISTDITEQKQLEQALIQSNEDLARFAYASSHDLQEPLRIISSFSTLLERRIRGRLDEQSEQFLTYIVDGAQRMTGLVNDLLQYSQVSTADASPQAVDLNAVFQSALMNLQHSIEESGAKIVCDVLPQVQGNEGLLERVFQNLIGNSIKYRHPDRAPEVHVRAENFVTYWQFSVTDNGIGFKSEYSEQVFVMFKRLHGAAHYAGSGIGLAIVKRIVERHGGSVRAESEPGKGSTFYFSLPAHYEAADDDQPAGSS